MVASTMGLRGRRVSIRRYRTDAGHCWQFRVDKPVSLARILRISSRLRGKRDVLLKSERKLFAEVSGFLYHTFRLHGSFTDGPMHIPRLQAPIVLVHGLFGFDRI